MNVPMPERPWHMFCTKCGQVSAVAAKDVQNPAGRAETAFALCPCGYYGFAEQDKGHSDDQLRAYGASCARAALEEAARVCKREADAAYKRYKEEYLPNYYDGQCDMANALHDAIRAMAKKIKP